MVLSLEWLREFTDVDISDKEYCDAMTLSGSKVEGWEVTGSEIENVVVGKVTKIVRHENSDHMRRVCSSRIWTNSALTFSGKSG